MKIFPLWLCAFCSLPLLAFGQGSLTPPAAPTPTMKTLDQVEARTPIGALPFSVAAGGSYYLTGSLLTTASNDGITVNASNVTIDLNGFEIIGNGGAKSGVFIGGGVANVTIRNGTIRNWGGYAINGGGNTDIRVEKIVARNNPGSGAIYLDQRATVSDCLIEGNASVGINVLDGSVVRNCQVIGTTGSPGDGIAAGVGTVNTVISGCVTNGNSGYGIRAASFGTIENCFASSNALGGLRLQAGWSVTHCTTNANAGTGLLATGSTISNCVSNGNTNGGAGFDIDADSIIENCKADSNDGAGITGSLQCTIQHCSVTRNHADGILVQLDSVVAENYCGSNGSSPGTAAGIHTLAGGSNNRIEHNILTGNLTRAIRVEGSNCTIIRNVASGDGTTLYDIANGNEVGKILQADIGGAILGSSGGHLHTTGNEPDAFTNFAN